MKRKIGKVCLALLVSGLLVAALGVWYYHSAITKPRNFNDEIFLVERGDSLSSIANELLDQGVIEEAYTLKLYARLNHEGMFIKAGEYKIPDEINLAEFVSGLVSGKGQIGIKITIIEGWTFKQMREQINQAPKLNHETANWSDQQIMRALGVPDLHPEGQFYPDTYHYRRNESDLSLYKKAFDLMQDSLDLAWANRKQGIQLKSRYEALILASIIEKESQALDELSQISGVFDNRLREGMRLQTDPTVIYGIGDAYKGNITRKHLKTDTPYNTYTRDGLPPTPISLPGRSAITAAVNPEQTKAFYFVAKGGGKHQFSKTLAEHNAAVKKYILKQ